MIAARRSASMDWSQGGIVTERTQADLWAALGKIPSGCSVLTTTHAGRSSGILASWIQQASFEPPMLTLALRHDRPILKHIRDSGRFVINMIDEKNQRDLFSHFGKATEQEPFEGLECQFAESGVILADALGYLECRLSTSMRAGDHEILAAEVVSGFLQTTREPYVHIRKSAANY